MNTTADNVRYNAPQDALLEGIYRRISWRLIPLLCGAYVLAFIDRVNIGFAQLQMKVDLNFGDAVYGLGAGIFFLGYFLFEVPSNLLLNRIGARKTLCRIAIGWGVASAATMFVKTPEQFYFARFITGVCEAGLVPGAILYLSMWLPAARRARSVAFFFTATVIAAIIFGPLTGWIMTSLNGLHGLRGWQWVFLVEGLPSVFYGVLLYFYLPDLPKDAKWLSTAEKNYLQAEIEKANALEGSSASGKPPWTASLSDPMLYILSLVSFLTLCGVYAVTFWMPQMISATGIKDTFHIGLYAMIPNFVTLVSMVLLSRNSDRIGERRFHFAAATSVGGVGLIICTVMPQNLPLSLLGLAIAQAGLFSALPIFWAQSSSVLPRLALPASLAIINSFGNLGGFVAPSLIGFVKVSTGSLAVGLQVSAALAILAGFVLAVGTKKRLSTVHR